MKSISFRSEFIPKILSGEKTQTRRLVKPQPIRVDVPEEGFVNCYPDGTVTGRQRYLRQSSYAEAEVDVTEMAFPIDDKIIKSPFGVPGDRIVIKQASHITLEITNVRVERVSKISEEDAYAEGVDDDMDSYLTAERYQQGGVYIEGGCPAVFAFKDLWEKLYPGSWDRNDWVWVYEFKLVTQERKG